MSKPEPLIHMRGIYKYYELGGQTVRALDGIDLDIFPGEMVAIMGPSGSGKSTLMHIVGALDTPTEGLYQIDGIDVSEMDEFELAALRNLKIGFVFQGFNLLARTTALENVELPLVYAKRRDKTERALLALERVGLADRVDHKPNELSGGQQQRVAIARAIAGDPRLILADEPTGNLSTQQSEEIMQIFQELNDEGRTVVMVTHEQDIGLHCKRIVNIRDGRVLGDEDVETRLIAGDVLAKLAQERAADEARRHTRAHGTPVPAP